MKPDEHTAPPDVTTFNPASSKLLALTAQQPFFKGLDERLIELLADSILEMHFKPGAWIYQQGESANRFYLIMSPTRRTMHTLTPFAKVCGTTITYPVEVSQSKSKKPPSKRTKPQPAAP
jgi:hypothetical protein